jgi:hypothetical protein
MEQVGLIILELQQPKLNPTIAERWISVSSVDKIAKEQQRTSMFKEKDILWVHREHSPRGMDLTSSVANNACHNSI